MDNKVNKFTPKKNNMIEARIFIFDNAISGMVEALITQEGLNSMAAMQAVSSMFYTRFEKNAKRGIERSLITEFKKPKLN